MGGDLPGISGTEYGDSQSGWGDKILEDSSEHSSAASTGMVVDLGDVDDDTARWWAAILAPEGGWDAKVLSDKGHVLHSPWCTEVKSEKQFTLSRSSGSQPPPILCAAPSFVTALSYLSSYCEYHDIMD